MIVRSQKENKKVGQNWEKRVSVTHNEGERRSVNGRVSKQELRSFTHKRYKCVCVSKRERDQEGGRSEREREE